MGSTFLQDLPRRHAAGQHAGIVSVCSAHPIVIEAALLNAKTEQCEALIEATCNQVNQDGGYTGMTPADFRRFVQAIADRVGFDRGRLILGGDHLGPNPWKHLPADEALDRSRAMIDAFIRAGFTKIHLDTSMGCAGEPVALSDATTAERAAALAAVAEAAAAASGFDAPSYVIGTEVPIPGGALEALDHLQVTTPDAVAETIAVHRAAFAARGQEAAFARAIGVVTQPGVEFGNDDVVAYDRAKATSLSASLAGFPQFVFEAHSTDYQPASALQALVADGFSILKVGPWLTFALREALYGLDHIRSALDGRGEPARLQAAMEGLMSRHPQHWDKYYHGDEAQLRLQRHFSYSDRIRYYWPDSTAAAEVDRLSDDLTGMSIPATLISQYLAGLYPDVVSGRLQATPRALMLAAVGKVLTLYSDACRPAPN